MLGLEGLDASSTLKTPHATTSFLSSSLTIHTAGKKSQVVLSNGLFHALEKAD